MLSHDETRLGSPPTIVRPLQVARHSIQDAHAATNTEILGDSFVSRKVQRENPGMPPRNITADADESVGLLVESSVEGVSEMRIKMRDCVKKN